MPITQRRGKPLMPTINKDDLFNRITDEENMYKAYKKSLKSKGKYKIDAMIFSQNETYNLRELRNSLINETYEFSGYFEFPVFEPKERVINAPFYIDKVVQLSINNILKQVYNKCFIHDSYACIDNKGTHKCVDRISYFMRKAKWQYGEDAYIVKMDIKKFFYSIDRKVMKDLLPKRIKCKRTLNLLAKIIDSANDIDPLGMPLGNTLSQICANIYMNEVDQYAKRSLSLKYYVRYADDIIIIVENKQKAINTKKLITKFANEKLNLMMNENKTKIFPIEQGVNAIGYKIYSTHRLLRNDSKKKIKRKARKFPKLYQEGKISIEKIEQILNSWLGHAGYASSYNFIESLIKRNDYIYISNEGNLKVNKIKLRELDKGGIL